MATCTPLYKLPVVEGSDRPCDYDDHSCDFAAAVEVQLDALDDVVNRTATTVPAAWLRLTGAESYDMTVGDGSTNEVIFTEVVLDTDDMVDLSVNSSGFTFTRRGLYLIWFNVNSIVTSTAGTVSITYAPRIIRVNLFGAPNQDTLPRRDFDNHVSGNKATGTSATVTLFDVGDQVFLAATNLSGTNGDKVLVVNVDFGVIWVGDAP